MVELQAIVRSLDFVCDSIARISSGEINLGDPVPISTDKNLGNAVYLMQRKDNAIYVGETGTTLLSRRGWHSLRNEGVSLPMAVFCKAQDAVGLVQTVDAGLFQRRNAVYLLQRRNNAIYVGEVLECHARDHA